MADPPRLLLLETSGKVGQVGLALGAELRGTRRLDETRRHARDLVPAVKELLAEQGWRPGDLQAVIVSRGPGSYTGLRVGLISAQTLAYATGCAVLGIDTFAVIARQTPPEVASVLVIADAQQERVYVQRFVGGQAAGALAIRPLAEVVTACDPADWLSGPGLHLHAGRLPPTLRTVDPGSWDPQIDSLLALGLARYERGERDDLGRLEPLYARPSSAEEKWGVRH
jgi:tRNA threonylcarbamoyladenosine biosynthesis protein TsaB